MQRLLRPGGKCCIVPIFLADQYVELPDLFGFTKRFDRTARFVLDPTASLPGGRLSGGYARIYDLQAFERRIVHHVDLTSFRVTILELRIDGDIVPDLQLECHKHATAINRPYRAMVVERPR